MKSNLKRFSILALGLSTGISFAASNVAPQYLVTHNKTSVESNAFIDGTIPSPYPTKANANGKVLWPLVKMACFGHTKHNHCSALILMETDTNHPVELGMVSMQLDTGEITPGHLVANGYVLDVNGPAEVTLSKE